MAIVAVLSSAIGAADLEIAKAALRDGLWEVARTHAAAVGGEEARLVILESYASEDRWDAVKGELAAASSVTNSPALDYYRAVVDGRLEAAAELLKATGSVAGLAEGKMLEADLRLKSGSLTAAKALWAEVIALTNVSERALALASVNLGDVPAMRKAYAQTLSAPLKRRVGLRLGLALLEETETEAEGARLIRAIAQDLPDADGASEAFLAIAAASARAGRWQETVKNYADAIESWPSLARRADVQEGRGEAFLKLGRYTDALEAFANAEDRADFDADRARVILLQGDVLSELGRGAEAMQRYRTVLEKYPTTETAVALKRLIGLRERETHGRDLYKAYRFEEARKVFAEVAAADPTRESRMAFFEVLCLYGLGQDAAACEKARQLAETCADLPIKAEAVLWLAKFTYNRSDWKDAVARFVAYAELRPTGQSAATALLWAARAAFAANDYAQAIQLVTRLVDRYPETPAVAPALLVQAEALREQARFDEAVLVLDRMAADETTSRSDRLRARLLKADALFALGADDPARYQAALEAYRSVRFGDELDADRRLVVDFKIGRVLEKLKRTDEAIDHYYSQVILVYRDARQRGVRFGDEARTAFTRAVNCLADEFEAQKRNHQAVGVLTLLAESDVPGAEAAGKRIQAITKKGHFL